MAKKIAPTHAPTAMNTVPLGGKSTNCIICGFPSGEGGVIVGVTSELDEDKNELESSNEIDFIAEEPDAESELTIDALTVDIAVVLCVVDVTDEDVVDVVVINFGRPLLTALRIVFSFILIIVLVYM